MGQIVALVGIMGIAIAILVAHKPRGEPVHSEDFEWEGQAYRLVVYQHDPLHWFVALPDGREILEGFSSTINLAREHAIEALEKRGTP